MSWTFFIDEVQANEPIGFKDLTIRARRDENWHGIFFEATTSDLTFYGDDARLLQATKNSLGFAASVVFRAVWSCDEGEDVLIGRFDFRRYRESCGNECLVTMPIEQQGCIMTLRNRYDQKVDLSNQKSFNGITILENYPGLNFEMDLPGQELQAAVEGYVLDEGDVVSLTIFPTATENFWIRPSYNREIYNSIATGQLVPTVFAASDNGFNDSVISPVLLLEDDIACFDGDFNYNVRLKGSYNFEYTESDIDTLRLVVARGEFPGSLTVLHTQALPFSGEVANGTFDYSYSGVVDLTDGEGFYVYLECLNNGLLVVLNPNGNVTFDKETYVNIYANQLCPETEAVVSLVHETASRITEAITDVCLKVKSDYYGRTDSEPYTAAADGCGSLRVLSSGLRIRNAENPKHFMSLKDLFDGLNGIDNIGMGVEGDWLRIEPMEYFYQDELILSMPFIPKATFSLDPEKAYSIIRIGYKKWETEGLRGLDEFNSNKEFRTSLVNINNTLDLTSPFIAAGYVIEQTRQQSFAQSGGADTKYDNDTFIICVERTGYTFQVEQGNIDNGTGFFSPSTAYNWRIRPWYNLMRWWKSLAQSYTNLINTTSKLIFSAGTGNLVASGELPDGDPCKLENGPKAENKDLVPSDFETENLPIWKAETVEITYPMSLKDFNLVKANPYGYIDLQCGNGDYVKAFIINLNYKPARGQADLTLRLKWL